MSISSTPKQNEQITREKFSEKASIKKIIEHTSKLFVLDPTNALILLGFFITGIGEMFGVQFNWKWYILMAVIISIFVLDKFDILKKEGKKEGNIDQVIINSDDKSKETN